MADRIEEIVRIDVAGQVVVGTYLKPELDQPAPVVLLLHGFTGTRDEAVITGTDEGVFSRTARKLAGRGIASLRIDFRGSGDSDGQWEDMTFSSEIADAVASVGWLQHRPDVDPGRMAVLGWSVGGLVAAHTAAERPDIAAAILWTPVAAPLWTFTGVFGRDKVGEALKANKDEILPLILASGGETRLKAAFFQELATTSPVAAAAAYPGPLMVMVGSRDPVVTPSPGAGEVYLRYHNGPGKLLVLDCNHAFNIENGPQLLDELIDESVTFIEAAIQ